MELTSIPPTAEIIGGLILTAFALMWTYFNIKYTKGPRERAFAVKAAVILWIGNALSVVLPFLSPSPIHFLTPWIVLVVAGRYLYEMQRKIRTEEEKSRYEPSATSERVEERV